MRKYLAMCWMLALMLGTGCSPSKYTEFDVEEEQFAKIVKGNTQFAFDLYTQLAASPGNLFFSPCSISTALAMTYAGAQGETQAQMQRVLRFPQAGEPVHACFGTLLFRLTEGKTGKARYKLSIANRLWAEERPYFKFAEPFLAVTRDYYASELTKVSFSKDSAGAVKTINDWVSDETQNKIRELLQPGNVGPDTTLILTNAIYFKGDWATRIDKRDTKESLFYLNAKDTVPVPMMHHVHEFEYTETEAFQALEMPYKGETLSMIVLLPRERDGLSLFERTLSAAQLDQWLGALRKCKVEIYMPRFKIETGFCLKDALASMGMPLAFDGLRADFKAMVEYTAPMPAGENIFISDVVHKAYVDVNEEGTEAAAATAVMTAAAPSNPKPRPVFRADHPFIFLIRDNSSGSVLFLGRVVNPGK